MRQNALILGHIAEMADRYGMAHLNNNKEVKCSERADNQRPGNRPVNRVDDPMVRAPDKEKEAVSGQQNSGSKCTTNRNVALLSM